MKRVFIDFNFIGTIGHSFSIPLRKGMADAYWTNRFFADPGFPTQIRVQQMRSTVSGQLPDPKILLLRPIPLYGLCPTHLQRKPSRYRNLSAGDEAKTLPCRLPWPYRQEHSGRRQRKTLMANICRLRPDTHRQGADIIQQRQFRYRPQKCGVRTRLDNNRLVPDLISVGTIPKTQKRRQGAYADGLKRLYTLFYPHYRRFCARCQFPRRSAHRTRRVLHHGSRLHRLCTTIHFYREHGLLSDTRQNQSRLCTHQLSHGGQNHRSSQRPNHYVARPTYFTRLSGAAAPYQLLRRRHQQTAGLYNQQFYPRCAYNRQAVQVSLADRTVLQVAQTASAYQGVFRHIRQCRQDPDMDCRQRLCPDCHHKEGTATSAQFGRNPANPQHCPFRASPATTSTYENSCEKRKPSRL